MTDGRMDTETDTMEFDSTSDSTKPESINEADYIQSDKVVLKSIKKEKEAPAPAPVTGKRRAATVEDDYRPERKASTSKATISIKTPPAKSAAAKNTPSTSKKIQPEPKIVKKEEVDLKGLEEMYYGVRDGLDVNFEDFPYASAESDKPSSDVSASTTVDCPICDLSESFDSNEKLQTHLVSHITVDGKDHQFQCLFCLDKHPSETVLAKHNQIMHPTETKTASSASYHCLICQQRFNNLHHLTLHLQKVHNMLELPYACQACGYRSSSHRDVVRHFYDDHKNQNFLQCPFCLDIFRFAYKGRVSTCNIENYYMHLRQHVGKKDIQLHCTKCSLSFIDKGAMKQHIANHHTCLLKSTQKVNPLLSNSMLITPPKIRSHHREPLPYTMRIKYGDFFAFIDGCICAECNAEIINEDHFTGLLKCNKCNYKTCCERAMFEHAADCNGDSGARDVMELPLPNEMHCVCGFSTSIGNKMAHHLAICGQKSAYSTVEAAQENTVKRNMLDMLGLVRRDGDAGAEGEEQQQPEQAPAETELQQQQQAMTSEQAPIPFGEMEAAPVMDAGGQGVQQQQPEPHAMATQQTYGEHVADGEPHPQYHLGFGQPEVVPQHALNASDIDMPLIGELADPNPPPTPQFLGEVHTPMFDAVAAAEQQHYHQLMQQHQHPQQHQ